MKTTFRLARLFGIGAAVVNFFFCFMILICGLFISPIAAGLAVYFSYKEFQTRTETTFGAQIGLIVGSIGSIGSILGAVAAGLFANLPFALMAIATAQDASSRSDIWINVLSSGVGVLLVAGIALLLSLLSIGLCIVVGVITSKVIANQNSSSKISPENFSG